MLPNQEIIAVEYKNICYLCNSKGSALYKNLKDRLYSVPGDWGVSSCAKCGLLWLNPSPTKEDAHKTYRTYYTHSASNKNLNSLPRKLFDRLKNTYIHQKYGYDFKPNFIDIIASKLIYLYPGRRADFDFNVFYLNKKNNGTLLDVGCGSGIFIENMANLGWNAEGIDFDKSAVLNAQSKGLKVNFGDLKSQNIKENSFDAITMSHVLEHVYDPITLLKECLKILKPNGKLMIATPNNQSLAHKIYKINWFPLDPPRHLFIFNPQNLIQIAKLAGFKKLSVQTSIRGGAGIFVGSKDIKKSGHYDMNKKRSFVENIRARIFEYIGWLILKFDKNAGEEIILSGEK